MKCPSPTDRVVRVTAKLTDEVFGYDHWRAGQFSFGGDRQAVLVIAQPGESVDDLLVRIGAALASLPEPTRWPEPTP